MQECIIYGNNVIDFCRSMSEIEWQRSRKKIYNFTLNKSNIRIRIGCTSTFLLKKLMTLPKQFNINELEIYGFLLFRRHAKLIVKLCHFFHFDKLIIKSSYSHYDIEPIFCSLPLLKVSKISLSKISNKSFKLLLSNMQYTIQELNISRSNLSSHQMYHLSKVMVHSKITHLNLHSNHIVSDGVIYLSRVLPLTNLIVLNLHGNRLGNHGIEILSQYIPKCQSIRELGLSRTNIFSEGFYTLCYTLPQTKITKLNVADNFITQKDIENVLIPILPKTFITKILWFRNMTGHHIQTEIHSIIKDILSKNLKKQNNHNNTFQFKLFIKMLHRQFDKKKHFENNSTISTLCDSNLFYCIESFLKH